MLSILVTPNDEAMQQEVEMEFGSGVEDLLVPEKLNDFADCHVYITVVFLLQMHLEMCNEAHCAKSVRGRCQ